ncbi:MAG: isochorismatase family protein [Planktomarina sp.]
MTQTALILIDYQRGFDIPDVWGGARNNPWAEANALALLAAWRDNDLPVVFVQHASLTVGSPLHPDGAGFGFKHGFQPSNADMHIVKNENSAFVGTHLEVSLRRMGITDLVICGITTEHCVSTTTRMAGNLGFNVRLVGDAGHAWPKTRNGRVWDAETIHETELAILDGEFAQVVTTADVIGTL